MAKIFIDTNIFLDFYQTSIDPINLLEKFSENAKYFVLNNQSLHEFERNRVKRIIALKQNFKKNNYSPFYVSLLKKCEPYKNIIKTKDELKNLNKDVISWIDNIITNPKDDIIYQCLYSIWNNIDSVKFEYNTNILKKAHERKLIGNPPTSKDKYTIGDELHWEILLEYMNEDLVLLTRDGTFQNNIHFLRNEFENGSDRKLLGVYKKFTECLEQVGIKSSEELVQLDEKILSDSLLIPSGWETTSVVGERVYVTNGLTSGYTCKEPNIHFMCMRCGSYGPWSGTRCLSCGFMDDGD